ncbi:MAG: dihydrofolate reductase family protein [Knoellia sp.]
MATIYYTGCSLDGFIATPDHSLDWLVTRDIAGDADMGYETFKPRVGASAMGASTWQWLLDHEPDFMQETPTWVFTHRDFVPAAQVCFTSANVAEVHAEMVDAAGAKDVWIVGGGELVGQFHDVGLLDEVWVQYAPVTLGAGAPVLPRHVELTLEEVTRNRDFLCGRYTVVR